MKNPSNLTPISLGLSQNEMTAYIGLLGNHPVNGSQLSHYSGIPRAKIYEVLQNLRGKGMVVKSPEGLYAPLPPEELVKRLRHRFESDLSTLGKKIKAASAKATYDYVWAIQGYSEVLAKAKEMIVAARSEIYIRLFPEEGRLLSQDLGDAVSRGVQVKYISLGPPPAFFDLQIIHPESEKIEASLGGRTLEMIKDRDEILTGLFEKGKEDRSPISWTKNRWLVIVSRDDLRHDFFHYFVHKILEQKQELSKKEKRLYRLIKNDSWTSWRDKEG
jgi:sugar-specific transcriptional regulator TrmB